MGRFWQTAQQILDTMRAQPDGEGWMYETIRQHLKHPDVVPESYLRSMMMAILAAAHETTSNATANAFLTLLSHRKAWEDICANPALIPNAVEECLRVAGSIIAWRRQATADAVVGGVPIPKGSKLLLVQASANFDPRHFENPDEVDVYREAAVEHLTFGYGAPPVHGQEHWPPADARVSGGVCAPPAAHAPGGGAAAGIPLQHLVPWPSPAVGGVGTRPATPAFASLFRA